MSAFRQKRKRVDTAARDTPITSSPDDAAVTIDEDDDAAVDTTSSVAADDTASSVTDNPITPNTDVAAVTIDEDDDAAADTTSSVTRSACDQFSTPERVTLYYRIMSEQFTVGHRVCVQFGANASEFWFPAVIGRQNPDGTYQIIYQDSDESDATASNKAPERIKADCECDDRRR
jgi:hypothetical protein